MEVELCDQVVNVFRDQRAVSWKLSAAPIMYADRSRHTLHAITTCDATRQTFQPADMCLSLFQNDGMAFLQNLVDGNESLERLDFVGHDGLTGTKTQYHCDSLWQSLLLTPSCQPRRTANCGGRMYRQCMLGRVFLTIFSRVRRLSVWVAYVWERSPLCNVSMDPRSMQWLRIVPIVVALRMLIASSVSCLNVG